MNQPEDSLDHQAPSASVSYTSQQQEAIETRNCSIALAAGAGCGKTFVLTERFLSELDPEQGARDLGGIVAITFTERAAREMRSRIRQGCRARLQSATDEQVEYWLKIVRDVDSARISTIHSFCGTLLRAHAPAAGIDPQFVVLERGVADPLRRLAVSESTEQMLSQKNPDVIRMVREVGVEKLLRIIDRLILMRFQLRGADWESLEAAGLAQHWRDRFEQNYIPQLLDELRVAPEYLTIKDLLFQFEPGRGAMLERWLRMRELIELPVTSSNVMEWLTELRNNAMARGGNAKGVWPSVELQELIAGKLSDFRKWIDKVGEELQFVDQDLEQMAEVGHAAFRVAIEAIRHYEELKQRLGGLDFDDLLTRARNLLRSSAEVRQRAASGIEFLMVDEFQDTDPTQAEIVRALVGSGLQTGKLFLVGDAQQSIYRFRRADPRVFATLQQEIPPQGRLPLTKNFRSQPAILNFVNAVFATEGAEAYEPLLPFDLQQYSPDPAIEFMFSSETGSIGEDEGEGREETQETSKIRHQREGEWIAQRILQLLADPTPRIRASGRKGEVPKLRRVCAGDIVILFRALSDVRYYESALRAAGLDYYLVGGKAFYSQQEVFDLANLCRFLHDPTDHVSLLGVLRSPFCSLSDDVIFAIWRMEKDLWKGLQLPPPNELTAEQQDDVRRAVRVLQKLLSQRDRTRIAPLLRLALDLTGYDAALLTEFLGNRKLANLQKLLDLARDFDRVGLFGLSEFVDQLNTAVLEETDEELAATHPEVSNVIRLMTIHQSKGLEFPVVIVADMDRVGPQRTPEAVFDPDLGTLVSPTERHGYKPVHIGLRMHMARERREEHSESLRLLYVALTRAADHLILSGTFKNGATPRSPWMKRVSERFDLRNGTPRVSPETGHPFIPHPYSSLCPTIRVHDEAPSVMETGVQKPRGLPLHQFMESVFHASAEEPTPHLSSSLRRKHRPKQVSLSRLEAVLENAQQQTSNQGEQIKKGIFTSVSEPISAEELGTLVHAVLERLDFSQPESLQGILGNIWSSSLKRLTEEQKKLAKRLLEPFLKSEAARELSEGKRSYREVEFLLRHSSIFAGADSEETIITGKIDHLIEMSDGRWIIVDYKTGRRLVDDPSKLREAYRLQMGVYTLAVERILGRLPDEVWLVHLRQEDPVVRIPINPDELQMVREEIDRGIRLLTEDP